MSPPSAITSPRLTPMRKRRRRSSARSKIAFGHDALDFGRTAHRVDHAGEFRQHAVAGGLVPGSSQVKPGDAAVMLADRRIDQFDEMRLDAFVGAFLIGTHQARVAHHIGGEDRGETAGRGNGCGSPPCSGRSTGAIVL
jgi:hypothetical protein